MSILHKMISIDEITENSYDKLLYQHCPTGFISVLVEKHHESIYWSHDWGTL